MNMSSFPVFIVLIYTVVTKRFINSIFVYLIGIG